MRAYGAARGACRPRDGSEGPRNGGGGPKDGGEDLVAWGGSRDGGETETWPLRSTSGWACGALQVRRPSSPVGGAMPTGPWPSSTSTSPSPLRSPTAQESDIWTPVVRSLLAEAVKPPSPSFMRSWFGSFVTTEQLASTGWPLMDIDGQPLIASTSKSPARQGRERKTRPLEAAS